MTPIAQRATSPDPERLSRVGLEAFFRITDLWGLSAAEQMALLGVEARSTFYKWKKEGSQRLGRDTLERISYVLGIYKALQILLPDERIADAWVRRPNANPLYGGRTPLDRMLSGNVADLYVVRRHLDAERGGWN